MTPQSLGKALKRVTSALLKSSSKKVKVVSEIVKSFSPRKRKMVFDDCGVKKKLKKEAERKQRCDALSTEVITKVEEFYRQDGISRMLPGKKDFISVKTNNGREHRQKRLLLMNIREARSLFVEESGINIGLTKFSMLRPPQVQPMTAQDQQVCACKYHENIDLLLSGLSKSSELKDLPNHSEEIVQNTVCDTLSTNCNDRNCSKCGVDTALDDIIGIVSDPKAPVTYYQWRTIEKKVTKIKVESSVQDAIDDLREHLKPFSRHVYNIQRQYSELKHLKENLKKEKSLFTRTLLKTSRSNSKMKLWLPTGKMIQSPYSL